MQLAGAQIVECQVGLRERIGRGADAQRNLGGQGEEFLAVATREVGDGAERPLLPQDLIGKSGNVAHVNAAAHHRAAAAGRAQGRRHERAAGREDDGGVEFFRWRRVGAPRPRRAERAGKVLSGTVAGLGKGKDAPALMGGDLADDVRGRAEAVKAQAFRVVRHAQAAVADEARAKQRRGVLVRIGIGNRKAEALVRDGEPGIAAVERVAGEPGVFAEVFAAGAAVAAGAAGPAQPRNADARAGGKAGRARTVFRHAADDFVPRNERRFRRGQFAVDHVEIGPADGAGADPQQDLAFARRGYGD